MGANMAEVTNAASSIAGRNSLARSSDASTRSRAETLRQSSSPDSGNLSFSTQVATADGVGVGVGVAGQPVAEKFGQETPSTSTQLILAETRTREDQSPYADKSILGSALNSYNNVQASVRETIGLAKITASATIPRLGETA